MNPKYLLISNLKSIIDGTMSVKKIVDSFDSLDNRRQNEFVELHLNHMVNYVYTNVPYYHKLFIEYGIQPNQITSPSDLKKIPVLTKDILRAQKDQLQALDIASMRTIKRRSGGTTGEPIESILSKDATAYETFIFLREMRSMGWDPEMKVVKVFGGDLGIGHKVRFRSRVYQFMMDSHIIHPFDLGENNMHHLKTIFNTSKSICLMGYPSAINNLVELFKETSFFVKNVKVVITTSEQLVQDWKINISDYFNCEIRSYYGCGEVGSLGYQHTSENYLVPIEHVIVESDIDNDLLLTQLHNKAMPLIRYSNGDTGKVSSDYRNILSLTGRSADYFQRSDGSKVSPIFGTRSIQDTGIPVTKYQYVQNTNGVIEFRYVLTNGDLNETHKGKIRKIIRNIMKEEVLIEFINTNNFVVSGNGKHRICVKL